MEGIDHAAGVRDEILDEDPFKDAQGVKQRREEMLETVVRFPGLKAGQTQRAARFQIVIQLIDIRETMMKNLMFDVPAMAGRAQKQSCNARGPQIDPVPSGERAVVGVVKDVEAEGGGSEAEGYAGA